MTAESVALYVSERARAKTITVTTEYAIKLTAFAEKNKCCDSKSFRDVIEFKMRSFTISLVFVRCSVQF